MSIAWNYFCVSSIIKNFNYRKLYFYVYNIALSRYLRCTSLCYFIFWQFWTKITYFGNFSYQNSYSWISLQTCLVKGTWLPDCVWSMFFPLLALKCYENGVKTTEIKVTVCVSYHVYSPKYRPGSYGLETGSYRGHIKNYFWYEYVLAIKAIFYDDIFWFLSNTIVAQRMKKKWH